MVGGNTFTCLVVCFLAKIGSTLEVNSFWSGCRTRSALSWRVNGSKPRWRYSVSGKERPYPEKEIKKRRRKSIDVDRYIRSRAATVYRSDQYIQGNQGPAPAPLRHYLHKPRPNRLFPPSILLIWIDAVYVISFLYIFQAFFVCTQSSSFFCVDIISYMQVGQVFV